MTDESSYLEIVSFLKANGMSHQKDLEGYGKIGRLP